MKVLNYRVSQKKLPLRFCFISPLLRKQRKRLLYGRSKGRIPIVLSTEWPLSDIWLPRYVELKSLNQEMKKYLLGTKKFLCFAVYCGPICVFVNSEEKKYYFYLYTTVYSHKSILHCKNQNSCPFWYESFPIIQSLNLSNKD